MILLHWLNSGVPEELEPGPCPPDTESLSTLEWVDVTELAHSAAGALGFLAPLSLLSSFFLSLDILPERNLSIVTSKEGAIQNS